MRASSDIVCFCFVGALRKNSRNQKGQVVPSGLSSCLILFQWTWILEEIRMTAVLRDLKISSDVSNLSEKMKFIDHKTTKIML